MEARADPARTQQLFKGPGEVTPYLLRSAQPIPPAWAPLFKFPHSATSLGHKPARGLARSFLGPVPIPTLYIHRILFMI